MQNPRARNSRPARSFFRFTRATSIAVHNFFAKSWRLFRKRARRALEAKPACKKRTASGTTVTKDLSGKMGDRQKRAETVLWSWWRLGSGLAQPAPVPLFALLKFLALLICEIGSDLPVRLSDDLTDVLASVAPDIP